MFGAAMDFLQQPRARAGEIHLPSSLLLLLIIIERRCCSKCSLAKMATIVTIKGHRVIDIYESFDGSYWFVTERLWKQDSVIGGRVYKDDQILFGYVRLSACPEHAEFGNFSETELKLLGHRVWKVPQKNWPICPEVEVQEAREHRDHHGARASRRLARGRILPHAIVWWGILRQWTGVYRSLRPVYRGIPRGPVEIWDGLVRA